MEDNQAVEVVAQPGNNKKMMFLIIGLLVVLIGVVIAVAIYVVNVIGQEQDPLLSTPVVDVAPAAPSVEDIHFIPIGAFPINTNLLTGADGRNMAITLNFNIGVDIGHPDGPELVAVMMGAEPVMRNIALSVVRDMTASEVNSRDGSTMLSNEIQRRIQEEFQTNLITGIYIMDIFTAPSG